MDHHRCEAGNSNASLTAVDRDSRSRLAAIVRSYLHGEIKAFEFDERLVEFRRSGDSTVRFVADQLWYFYDDITDHYVVLSKPAWDNHQRLLLLLESDGQVATVSSRCWTARQFVCALCLALYVPVALWTAVHIGEHAVVLLTMPLGLFAWAGLTWLSPQRRMTTFESVLFPFRNLTELAHAVETTGFVKERFPQALNDRVIRSRSSAILLAIQSALTMIIAAPLVLLIGLLPERDVRTFVVFPTCRPL